MADKFKRKHYFINPKFQTRFLFSFSIPMILILLFIGFVMFFTTRSVVNSAVSIIGDEMHNIIQVKQMHIIDPAKSNEKIVAKIEEYVDVMRSEEVSGISTNILKSASKVIILGMIIVVFEMALLTVFVSHKIAGPIYRIDKFCEAFGAGDLTSRIFLRKGDELMETASKVNAMADIILKNTKDINNLLSETNSQTPQEKLNKIKEIVGKYKIS